jgi:hypothetical protein
MKVRAWMSAAGLAVLLPACGASGPAPHPSAQGGDGQVVGTLVRVGGPLGSGGKQPRTILLMGTVQFSAAHRPTVAVRVGKSGRFSIWLPAATYRVSGRSPSIIEELPTGPQQEMACSPQEHVTVVPARAVRIAVVCSVP